MGSYMEYFFRERKVISGRVTKKEERKREKENKNLS